jgi:hypothetical protein
MLIINCKSCIGSKLSSPNYKCNLTFRNTFVFFSFTDSLYIFKYSHLIEPGVEGQKVASHEALSIIEKN